MDYSVEEVRTFVSQIFLMVRNILDLPWKGGGTSFSLDLEWVQSYLNTSTNTSCNKNNPSITEAASTILAQNRTATCSNIDRVKLPHYMIYKVDEDGTFPGTSSSSTKNENGKATFMFLFRK
jgi:hypothetical protein